MDEQWIIIILLLLESVRVFSIIYALYLWTRVILLVSIFFQHRYPGVRAKLISSGFKF
jgi:hypothetical protein